MKGISISDVCKMLNSRSDILTYTSDMNKSDKIYVTTKPTPTYPFEVKFNITVKDNRISLFGYSSVKIPGDRIAKANAENRRPYVNALKAYVDKDNDIVVEGFFYIDEEVSYDYVLKDCLINPICAARDQYLNFSRS